jgi:hypothetical protein
VNEVPRWLRLLASAAVAVLLVAVIQPTLGGLLLRTFAIGTALAIGVVGVAVPLHRLVPATAAASPRARRAPASVPRELDAMADSLCAPHSNSGCEPATSSPPIDRTAMTSCAADSRVAPTRCSPRRHRSAPDRS